MSIANIWNEYTGKLVCDILELCSNVMPHRHITDKTSFLSRLDERLQTSFVNYLGQHIGNIRPMATNEDTPFSQVGQSFVHCDLWTGTVVLLNLVRRSAESK